MPQNAGTKILPTLLINRANSKLAGLFKNLRILLIGEDKRDLRTKGVKKRLEIASRSRSKNCNPLHHPSLAGFRTQRE